MTDFLFIRHGETPWNREQRFQGQADPPLNALGLEQAGRLASRLAAQPADVLVCSDLLRARQTAAPLAAAWARDPVLEPGLREQAFGELEGWAVADVREHRPALWNDWLAQRADYALPGGGESLRQFNHRVWQAVRALADAYAGQRVAVVTHGGVLDMLWRTVNGLSLDGLRLCDIPNTGINHLRWSGGSLEILRWGDAAHLEGLPQQPPTTLREASAPR